MYQTKQLKQNTRKLSTKEQVQNNQELIDKLRALQSEVIGEHNHKETLLFNEIINNLKLSNIALKNA